MANMLVFLCILLVAGSEALRILVFFPMPSKSHSILGHGVANRLVEAGHEVVHVTSFPSGNTGPKLKEVSLKPLLENLQAQTDKYEAFKLKNLIGQKNVGVSFIFIFFFADIHKKILEEPAVSELLNDRNEKFDTVILEWMFIDAIAGIAPLFQCPLIWYGATEAHWQILRLVDEIPNPSYNVDIFSTIRPPLSFLERLQELWSVVKKSILYSLLVTPKEKAIFEAFLPIAHNRGVSMPSYEEAIYNGSLLLLNSHPSVGTPYRLPQNAKYIGGYHVDKNIKPLTKLFLAAGALEDLRDVEVNEKELENHPNLKLFITHGGQLSTLEAVHYGVQVIGIPTTGEQHVNMKSVVDKGFGIKVALEYGLVPELNAAIREMLTNDTYKTKVTERIYHDRPDPGNELVYWVEHVVRTRGAPHLRSPALGIRFHQKYYLDALAMLMVLIIAIRFILKYLIGKFKASKSNKITVRSKKE